jgi:hypothetical protein
LEILVRLSAGPDVVGIVRDAEGKPVAGAAISSGEKFGTTNAEGKFTIHSPRTYDGKAYITVNAKGFVPLEATLRPTATCESLALERPYELVVRAQMPEGAPPKDFTAGVFIPVISSADARAGPEAIRAEPGQVRMTFYTPGRRTVWARAKGVAMAEVAVDVARNMGPVVVKFSRGVAVTGNAKVADGKFAAGEVSLRRSVKDFIVPQISVPLKDDGSYCFDHVGPGLFDLAVSLPGRTVAKTTVTVANADLNVPAIQVRGTGTIAGQVFWYEGDRTPWPQAKGTILAEDGKEFTFQADGEGRFRAEGVTLGKARLFVSHSEGCLFCSLEASVEVLENKTQEVTIAPPPDKPATQPAATRPATP